MIKKTRVYQEWIKDPWGDPYLGEVLPIMKCSPVGAVFVMKIGYILKIRKDVRFSLWRRLLRMQTHAYIVMPEEVEDAAYKELEI